MKNPAIIITNITKQYYLEKPRTLKRWFHSFFSPFEKFTVIKNFSLKINEGEFILIVGPNGCGKTTLLKIIAGITEVDEGKVITYGKVVPLIELSAGFNVELTGRENIITNATILGIKKQQITKIIPKIISFSGIGRFIDIPLKRYSSGMISRLAFAIAAFSKPDILLLDEIFAVGDEKFRNKAFRLLKKFKEKGTTIILSLHFNFNLSLIDRRVKLQDIMNKRGI